MLVEAKNLDINFGTQEVLRGIDLRITNHSRIGLVGVNGAGKSTLIKCLTQELEPSSGSISVAPYIRLGYLTQNPELTMGNTLKEELYSVFPNQDDPNEADYRLDEKIGRMVTGLGFSLEELEQPVDKFSGGWQMRINLAKVLLQEADLMLMDEPTNHLDMKACQWLENFLRSYPKGILMVSHDRRFLDEVCTEIAELERGELTIYPGNYSQYLEQREIMREQLSSAAQRQKKHIKEQMDFVNKFRASARKSTQAKSREKQLAKLEIIEGPRSNLKKLAFKFPLQEPSGSQVLNVYGLNKSFADRKLFSNVNLELEWSKEEPQKVFILGENGCGKTTLFKTLMGLEPFDSGEVKFGSRVKLGYYAQHQLQTLELDKTVLRTMEELMQRSTQGEIRALLGRFLFSGDEVFKEVGALSGGEKARLAIAKLMVSGPNVLLLDEPTNHLDLPAQEAIEAALRDYQGTIICVSHDRHLIENLATQIWDFKDQKIKVYKGDYQNYLEKSKVRKQKR